MSKFEKPPKYVYSFETNESVPDLTQIFDKETHHLSDNFMSSMARFRDSLSPDVQKKGDGHLRMCESCRQNVTEIKEKYKEPEQQLLREE